MSTEAQSSAEVIIIPKQVRMDWTDLMALDTELSNMAFRAACVIGYHLNRKSGSTFLRKDTIARLMGVSERAAWNAVAELEKRGYLVVKRRDLGTVTRMTSKGPVAVRVAGGKGVANTYLPAFQSSHVAATYRSGKLASQCELWWEQRSQNRVAKVAPQCDPTLTSPSEKNPTRASARARGGAAHDLGPCGDRLRQRIGDELFASWFGKATTRGQSGKSATIVVPTRFLKSEIQRRFADDVLACWQAEHPEVERLEILVEARVQRPAHDSTGGASAAAAPSPSPVSRAAPGGARGDEDTAAPATLGQLITLPAAGPAVAEHGVGQGMPPAATPIDLTERLVNQHRTREWRRRRGVRCRGVV